jgi:cytochrome c oxidase assembly factor CtaG
MIYNICSGLFLLAIVIFFVLFYLLTVKIYNTYYFKCVWANSVNLQKIVDDIIYKATVISIIINRTEKLPEVEKYNAIVEKATAICADVMMQHNIQPKEYNLEALVKVELFKLVKDKQDKGD